MKSALSLPDNKQEESAALNKDFLPVEIRGILDDLQLDSSAQAVRQEAGEGQNQKSSAPEQVPRSHSPVKRKPDKITANEDPPVISKKRHYDTDEVRQYIVRQQEERRRRQHEEKKAQKEATEQKNKRLQELYRRQREAFSKAKTVPPSDPLVSRRLQETYSKLLLEKTLLEEPARQHVTQDIQVLVVMGTQSGVVYGEEKLASCPERFRNDPTYHLGMLRSLQTTTKTFIKCIACKEKRGDVRKLKLKSLQYWSPLTSSVLLYFCFVFIVLVHHQITLMKYLILGLVLK